MKTNIATEQRKNQREDLRENLVCMLHIGMEVRVGILTNINKDGLSFKYFDQGYKNVTTGTSCYLSLLETNGNALIPNIDAKIIYDRFVEKEKHDMLIRREIAVEFKDLSFGDIRLLSNLIEYYLR